MKLDTKALGVAAGSLLGLTIFALTLRNVMRGQGGDHLNLLSGFIPGYHTGVSGAIIGLIGGFVIGFVGAWLLGWVYNKMAR